VMSNGWRTSDTAPRAGKICSMSTAIARIRRMPRCWCTYTGERYSWAARTARRFHSSSGWRARGGCA
jgi:hypothetical protein